MTKFTFNIKEIFSNSPFILIFFCTFKFKFPFTLYVLTNDVSELVQVAKNSGINGIKIFSELFSADAVDDDDDSDELDL